MKLKRRTRVILVIVFIFAVFLVLFPILMDREKIELSPGFRSQLTGSFIQLEEGFVHYELVGPPGGRVVVLVSGFPSTYRLWDKTLAALTGAGFRVLRYDLFGSGTSDRPRAVYHEQFFTKQLYDLLEKLEISGPVDLVGHSLGGVIAVAFTNLYPIRVRRLVLIAPLHEEVDITPLDVPGLGEYFGTTALIFYLEDQAAKFFYKPDTFPGWKGMFGEQFKYKGFRRACLSALRNFISQDQFHRYRELGNLGKSTLLIWGKSDPIIPFREGIARLKDILKAEVLVVDNASHAIHWEQAGIVNPPLIEFLSK